DLLSPADHPWRHTPSDIWPVRGGAWRASESGRGRPRALVARMGRRRGEGRGSPRGGRGGALTLRLARAEKGATQQGRVTPMAVAWPARSAFDPIIEARPQALSISIRR